MVVKKPHSRLCGNVATCRDDQKEQVFQETWDNIGLQEKRLLQCFAMLKWLSLISSLQLTRSNSGNNEIPMEGAKHHSSIVSSAQAQ